MSTGITKLRGRRQAAFALRAAALGCAAALPLLSGCAIEPWVKPYERDRIADPIMSWDRDPVSSAYMHHVYEAREGARGATGSAGGGCGCN
jgi:hypothetical protein